MPLEEYRRKRDFTKTPEPRGGEGKAKRATAAATKTKGFPGWNRLPRGRRFCVQMHRARRLHFDLRLEHNGVLLSWAVPKGPTLDPEQKRLAVHVEDHPIEYGQFEGRIPEGYGAGTVMLWDAGTFRWEPETAEDVDAALRRGDLKFALEGQKLRGEFALVRLGRRGRRGDGATKEADDDRNWLLIKKRDAAVVPGMEAAQLDHSVKTGRSLAEIAAGGDAEWKSRDAEKGRGSEQRRVSEKPRGSRQPRVGEELRGILEGAPRAPLPQSCSPMLATTVDRPFTRSGWVFEMKYDGVRALATVRDGTVRLRGRSGRDETARYPELAAVAPAVSLDEALIDGEIVALDEQGRPSFERLQQRINVGDRGQVERAAARVPVTFMAFDLIAADGHDLREMPLERRKRALQLAITGNARVIYADHVETDGEALFVAVQKNGVEGIVGKRASSVYEAGRRSAAWVKVKAWNEQDCVICGYTAARGGGGGIGALVLGVHVGGRLVHAGQAGSGIGGETAGVLLERLRPLAVDKSPLTPTPQTDQPATWVRPELVCTVRFTEWTSGGTMRHPTFRVLRDDLRPEDSVREDDAVPAEKVDEGERSVRTGRASRGSGRKRQQHPESLPAASGAGTAEALEQLAAMQREGRWEIAGRTLRLTNLDKLLWPEGISKRDMIAYYVRMAPVLLPHLRDRPLGMQVFPDGIGGKHFWRKRIPEHAPDWIRTWEWRGETEVTYIVVEETATLAWLANSAVIDLHPWHSRIDAPEKPDWAVFDLDPFPPATFEDVVLVARLVKAALDHYGLHSEPKLSGQTGLQIYVPIRRGPDYATVRAWVEDVSRAIGQVIPDKISWEWEVARRTGRLRLDYTQNVLGKTLAAPYSLRPAPGAPVSAPIRWEELDDPALRPDRYTMATIEARLAEVGDLFAPVLDGGQDLPAD
jgi:bifunctional non-homologous end joining protein LigD